MRNTNIIRTILSSQDPEKIEKFIRILSAFTDDLSDKDIDISRQPFPKTSLEYKQLKKVHDTSKALIKALGYCTESGALKRLSHILETPNLNYDTVQVMRIYSATCYALKHQQRTSTGGRPDSLSEVDKLKLRRLKSLFKRYFPDLSDSFNSENNQIYNIGCHILGQRHSLGLDPDNAIKQKSLA
ncbi:MAG: hypothetical protein ACXWF8_16995 [Methylobacter sp.]